MSEVRKKVCISFKRKILEDRRDVLECSGRQKRNKTDDQNHVEEPIYNAASTFPGSALNFQVHLSPPSSSLSSQQSEKTSSSHSSVTTSRTTTRSSISSIATSTTTRSSTTSTTISFASSSSSSDHASAESESDDENSSNPLPAAFAHFVDGEQGSEEEQSEAEMSDHEAEMVRKSKQIRIRERWKMLLHKLFTKQFYDDDGNDNDDSMDSKLLDNSLLTNSKEKAANEQEEWNEEREREFVFSLL